MIEPSFATTSYCFNFFSFGLQIMQIWSINYSLHLEVSRYTNIVYIGRCWLLIYIERFFSTACCFFSYICQSVNCMSWISKFHNFFLTCAEIKARFIFEGFKNCPLWEVHFQHSGTFLVFFIWSANCSREFFSHFVSR